MSFHTKKKGEESLRQEESIVNGALDSDFNSQTLLTND